ncbi:MAG: tetraacyldisaccharide 4'-kinase [Proteobacteria bacterium]|nr:tetraacyldisaccharide 4'-kinase [Pseudomonadota bacterium]
MKAPSFWYKDPGLLAGLLLPLTFIYKFLTLLKRATSKPYRATVPVICIGNLTVGGTGKTPTVIALAQRLITQGYNPSIVSRGYGGSQKGPLKVNEQIHKFNDVGDEPLLLSSIAPTWVAKNRRLGIIAAVKQGANIILLDDGFQNKKIYKDISIVTVDAYRGFGNGLLLPAGPLREPIYSGLSTANFLISIGDDESHKNFINKLSLERTPTIISGRLAPIKTGMDWENLSVFAFAGIGNPEKFFLNLRNLGAKVVNTIALSDHQIFDKKLLLRLETESSEINAQLVTTEKDAIRLPHEFRKKVLSLPVRLEISSWAEIEKLVEKLIPL